MLGNKRQDCCPHSYQVWPTGLNFERFCEDFAATVTLDSPFCQTPPNKVLSKQGLQRTFCNELRQHL